MTITERLHDFLNKIYIPKSKLGEVDKLMKYINVASLRMPNKNDAHKARFVVLLIHTKGKGKRQTFDYYDIMYVDFDKIGEKYALSYIYSDDGYGYPYRMDITSIKNVLII